MKLLAIIFCGFLGAGCSTASPPESAPTRPVTGEAGTVEPAVAAERGSKPRPLAPRAGVGDVAVARVGGVDLRRSDLGEFVIRYFRDTANEALTQLVDERIIEAEAKKHGITLPPGLAGRAVEIEMAEREKTVRVQFGADVSLERYLSDRYGVTVDEHRGDITRLVRVRLQRDRVIRFHQIGEERIEVRDAVFADLATAKSATAAARGGADLARLANDDGLRPGVVVPPFPKDDLSPPELAESVFALAVGEVSEPIAVDEGGREVYHVFKMVGRTPGRSTTWAESRDEVEAGIEERPLEQYEYLQWARQMREVYGVEVLR